MKKLFIYLLLPFYTTSLLAQIKDNSKVLTSTLSNISIGISKSKTTSDINPTLSTKSQGFGFNLEGTYGKINKNSLWSYGVNFSWRLNTQSNGGSDFHSIGFAPVLSYQKFYSITDRLYFSPFARLSVGYQYSKQDATSTSSPFIQKGIVGSSTFYPFSVTFSKNQKTNFLFMLGNVSINYDRTKSFYKPMLNNGKTISSNLTISASIAGVSFGIQKLF